MYLTQRAIFEKAWWSSIICGIAFAVTIWMITSISVFDGLYKIVSFADILILSSITGSYFGAGYLGWRIAEKHYNDRNKLFIKRYIRYSLVSFVFLVAVTFSPLSFLGLLWSLIAPYCVLRTLKYVKQRNK